MRDTARNLNHILLSSKDSDLVSAFTIGETTFEVFAKIPAEALVKLTVAESPISGMAEYVVACLAKEEQRAEFRALLGKISADGLGEIIEEIVSRTTPFEGTKPSA